MIRDRNNHAIGLVKGEGLANIVLQYDKSNTSNTVIRIRKRRRDDEISAAFPSSSLEQETWEDLFSAVDSSSLLALDLMYITKYIGPIVGLQYIPPQVSTPISLNGGNSHAHIRTLDTKSNIPIFFTNLMKFIFILSEAYIFE